MIKKNLLLLISIFFLIPIISSITLTNTTLKSDNQDYQIFVNNSITCDKLSSTNESIKLYNISTSGNFTNTGITTSIISFYGLQSAFPDDDIRWDNGTILTHNSENINVTIPSGRYIELGDFSPPVITIGNPVEGTEENSNPVNFIIETDEYSTCVYHLDSETNNFSMTTSDNYNFSASYSLQNGEHTATFYCTDNLSQTSSNSTTFNFDKLGTSSGSSVGSYPTYPTIKLSKLNYTYDDWIKGGLNDIFIYTYDIDENFFDIDSINVSIENAKDYDIEILRLDEGKYKSRILIYDNLSEANVKIWAKSSYKEIIKGVTIQLREPTTYEKIREEVEIKISKLRKFFDWIVEVRLRMILVISGIFLIFLSIVSYKIYKRKKK